MESGGNVENRHNHHAHHEHHETVLFGDVYLTEHKPASICFVFPAVGDYFSEESLALLRKIIFFLGKKPEMIYLSSAKTEIFVIIKPNIETIRAKADYDNFKLLLDKEELIKQSEIGFPEKGIKPIKIGYRGDIR
jgi:hypothetical protein